MLSCEIRGRRLSRNALKNLRQGNEYPGTLLDRSRGNWYPDDYVYEAQGFATREKSHLQLVKKWAKQNGVFERILEAQGELHASP